jgi:hypothetical protein
MSRTDAQSVGLQNEKPTLATGLKSDIKNKF